MRDRVPAAPGVDPRAAPAGEVGDLVTAQAQDRKGSAELGFVHQTIRKVSTALRRLGAAMGGVRTASKDSAPDHLKSVIDLKTGVLSDLGTKSGGIRIRTGRGVGAAGT